ncbi:uncharacterized protein UDID_19194 [Ustilago sp. UG-2017a]|nr:uncharacterized protein UDID_19194 [Ustilago sp. UG-2017a]
MAPPNHSERIESLEDQVRSLLAALNACNTQEPFNDSASAQQGFRSKEPEAFTGEQGHLEPFLAQVDVFLWLNPGRFINNSDQILWLSTLLHGVAHQWFYPHLSAVNPPAWLTDYPLFINQLRVVFGDPDRIATTKREIEALSQTTSVANYLTQFRQLQMTLNWGEDTMAWFFYRGLKENVKDDLSRSGKPTDLDTLVGGLAPETQVGLSRYSVTIKLCNSYCLGISLGELIARRLSSCAMTAGGVCCICYRRFRLTSVDTPFRGGSARSISMRRL